MKLINIYRTILNEEKIVKIPKPNKSFLYHGSNIKNLDSIKRFGLLPDFGDTVKGTESYQMYMDDEYYNQSEDRVDGVLFFSDNPGSYIVTYTPEQYYGLHKNVRVST